MGKRTGQLAGLAALGALGYMLSRDKKGESSKSETRSSAPSAAPSAAQVSVKEEEDNYPDESRRGRMASPPQSIPNTVVAAPVKRSTVAPAQLAPKATPVKEDYPSQDKSFNGPPVTDAYPDESRRGRMASAPENAYVPFAPERGSLRGPSAAQLQEHELSRYPDESRRGRMASVQEKAYVPFAPERGSLRGPSAAQLQEYEASRGKMAPAQKGAAPRPAAKPANAASQAAPEKKSGPTLGVPNRPAPGAPSIYAGKEAWADYRKRQAEGKKKGGAVKKMASGGMTVSKASSRADGIAQRGKTRGKLY